MPSRGSPHIAVAETCGIEFEVDNLCNSDFSEFKELSTFRLTHDASCETPKNFYSNRDFGIMLDNRSDYISSTLPVTNSVAGTELVSVVLDSTDESFLEIIKNLTEFLTSSGESPTSERSGIHFHFSLPSPNLRILKSIIRLGRHLESLFFTIGGMGYEFRGAKNDGIYCRPITKWGPPCVPRMSGYSQVFDVKDLLSVKKSSEFWTRYGELESHGGRYNPVRYTWLNLYPLAPFGEHRGTLEFRLFNKTLNPLFIYAISVLCRKFVEYSIISSFKSLKEESLLQEYSIFDTSITKQNLAKQLVKFSELSRMDEDVVQILMDILDRSPIPNMREGYVMTHITRELRHYWVRGSDYNPPIISREEIRLPDYVDIHLLTGARRR